MGSRGLAPFKLGKKPVYLYAAPAPHTPLQSATHLPPSQLLTRIPPSNSRPDFTITLLRTPFLPPTFAKFLVPLKLNKLDMRDYLWHAYGVKCNNVRSFVQQQKLRQDDPARKRAMPRRWYRGASIKKMTVEMDRPFAWPEEPEDWTPYVAFVFPFL